MYRYNTKIKAKLAMVVHTCNPSTQKVEAEILTKIKVSLGYTVRPCFKKVKTEDWERGSSASVPD
jgi:hypothetical protein